MELRGYRRANKPQSGLFSRHYFSIWLSQSDIRIYIDAENADVEPFDKDGIAGYFFKKEDLNYVCFERDACSFSVYGSLDMDELIKIAAGITKE